MIVVSNYQGAADPFCSRISDMKWGLSLAEYLLGFGIASLIIWALTVVSALLLDSAAIFYYIVSLCAGMFSFAWMIVGSVALFRDDHSCRADAYPLWAASLASVISYYVATFVNCVLGNVIRGQKN